MRCGKKLAAMLLAVSLFCIGAAAQQAQELYNEQFTELGAQEIIEALPSQIADRLDENGIISAEDAAEITSPSAVLESAANAAKSPFHSAVGIASALLVVILISSIFSAFELSDKGTQTVLEAVSVLAAAVICFPSIADAAAQICESVRACSALAAATLPVSAAVMMASGSVTEAAAVQGRTALITVLMSAVTGGFVLPLTESALALTASSSFSSGASIRGIMGSVKKAACTLLSAVVTVVAATLALQTAVASTSDSASVKAVGYTVSSFVPVVGGSLSEVLKTVMGCSELITTTVGAVSAASILVMASPPFFTAIFMQCALKLCAAAAQMTGNAAISGFLEELSSVLSILTAVLLSAVALLLLAIGLTLV